MIQFFNKGDEEIRENVEKIKNLFKEDSIEIGTTNRRRWNSKTFALFGLRLIFALETKGYLPLFQAIKKLK